MPSVLFVAPSAYTLSGLATWLDYLLPGLRERGWDARLGLVSGPRHHRPERYLEVHPDPGVHIAHCDSGTPQGRLRALERLLAEAPTDIAISVNIPDLFAAVDARRRQGKATPRALLSVHGIEAFLYADARRYAEVLDGVVCTNRLACELATRLGGIEPGRVLYAAYGVRDVPEGQVASADAPLRIVYSGRLEGPQKRIGDLVEIVRSLQARGVAFRLDIAGDGPERVSLEARLASERASGQVVFHGQLPIEALKSQLYANADAMIITSFWETGPIVAWEAMAQGLPVVSSRYIGSGLEGALEHGRNALLFEIGDAEAAAAALAQLAASPELRRHIAEGGAQLVATRYAIPVSVQRWHEVLSQVLAQPVRAAALAPPERAPAGRLDGWLGPALAESLRSLRKPRLAGDAGGEWPHSNARAPSDEAFWKLAQEVDRHVS